MLSTVEDLTEDSARAQLDTNFFGPFNTIKAVLPGMRERQSGTIVNFSSIGGLRAAPTSSLYGGSKFLIEGFSEALSQEVAPFGVRVLIVEPGAFRSDFMTGGNMKTVSVSDAYRGTVAEATLQKYQDLDGKQEGDVEKGAHRVYEVIVGEGMAKGKQQYLRLPLGDDCLKQARMKLNGVLENLEAYEDIARSTAHA